MDPIKVLTKNSSADFSLANNCVKAGIRQERDSAVKAIAAPERNSSQRVPIPVAEVPTLYLKDDIKEAVVKTLRDIAKNPDLAARERDLISLEQRTIEGLLERFATESLGTLSSPDLATSAEHIEAIRAQISPELLLKMTLDIDGEIKQLARKIKLEISPAVLSAVQAQLGLVVEHPKRDRGGFGRRLARQRAQVFQEQTRHGSGPALKQVFDDGVQHDLAELGVGNHVMINDPKEIQAYYEELKRNLTVYVPGAATGSLSTVVISQISQKLERIQAYKLKVLEIVRQSIGPQANKISDDDLGKRIEGKYQELCARQTQAQAKPQPAALTENETDHLFYQAAQTVAHEICHPDPRQACGSECSRIQENLAVHENEIVALAAEMQAVQREMLELTQAFCATVSGFFTWSFSKSFEQDEKNAREKRDNHDKTIEEHLEIKRQIIRYDAIRGDLRRF